MKGLQPKSENLCSLLCILLQVLTQLAKGSRRNTLDGAEQPKAGAGNKTSVASPAASTTGAAAGTVPVGAGTRLSAAAGSGGKGLAAQGGTVEGISSWPVRSDSPFTEEDKEMAKKLEAHEKLAQAVKESKAELQKRMAQEQALAAKAQKKTPSLAATTAVTPPPNPPTIPPPAPPQGNPPASAPLSEPYQLVITPVTSAGAAGYGTPTYVGTTGPSLQDAGYHQSPAVAVVTLMQQPPAAGSAPYHPPPPAYGNGRLAMAYASGFEPGSGYQYASPVVQTHSGQWLPHQAAAPPGMYPGGQGYAAASPSYYNGQHAAAGGWGQGAIQPPVPPPRPPPVVMQVPLAAAAAMAAPEAAAAPTLPAVAEAVQVTGHMPAAGVVPTAADGMLVTGNMPAATALAGAEAGVVDMEVDVDPPGTIPAEGSPAERPEAAAGGSGSTSTAAAGGAAAAAAGPATAAIAAASNTAVAAQGSTETAPVAVDGAGGGTAAAAAAGGIASAPAAASTAAGRVGAAVQLPVPAAAPSTAPAAGAAAASTAPAAAATSGGGAANAALSGSADDAVPELAQALFLLLPDEQQESAIPELIDMLPNGDAIDEVLMEESEVQVKAVFERLQPEQRDSCLQSLVELLLGTVANVPELAQAMSNALPEGELKGVMAKLLKAVPADRKKAMFRVKKEEKMKVIFQLLPGEQQGQQMVLLIRLLHAHAPEQLMSCLEQHAANQQ